jgi:uncharacterized protein YuzE
MKVEFSKHAVSQMAERNISEKWVVRALQEPDFVRDDKSRPDVKLAFRKIAEFGGRWLRVAYKQKTGRSFYHNGFLRQKSGELEMKVKYDSEVDAVFLRLTDADILESEEMQPGVIVDFDANGKIVALEFLNATERFSAEAIKQFQDAA